MAATEENLETEAERLVQQIAQVARSADPEEQDSLIDLASTLLNQELVPMGSDKRAVGRPMNPLAAGLGLCVLGGGLFLFIPAVGIMVGIIGLVGVVLGILFGLVDNCFPAGGG
jgi:hypothetical protein